MWGRVLLGWVVVWGAGVPVQLVRPTANYTQLEVTEEGLDFLNNINDSVAVISAVGAIHTGKSFMLNQLCDSTDGFSVGYTVRAETHGIWAMKYPAPVESAYQDHSSGYGRRTPPTQNTTVLFLDTEGLFSRDATSGYDARLFAITTLLSSEVIYNTVKFIDTHHMEALETLIRRTNLFGLRAYAARGGGVQDRVTNLSEFLRLLVPSHLSWVVQDFVQDLENQEPEAWLQRLLDGGNGNGGKVNSFFKSIDCVTLPVPASSNEVLQKLDQVSSHELDPTYLEQVSKFRRRLLSRAAKNPKLKTSLSPAGAVNGGTTPMSGRDIADLLQFLVDASNSQPSAKADGHEEDLSPFPELPSVAEQFTRLQMRLMKSDILTIVERDIRQMVARQIQQHTPMGSFSFERELERQAEQAMHLWNATITGVIQHKSLSGPVAEAEADFLASLEESKEKLRQVNTEMVREWCDNFVEEKLSEFKREVYARAGGEARRPQDLEVLMSEVEAPLLLQYKSVFNRISGTPDACQTDERKFLTQMREIAHAIKAENEVLLIKEIDEANKAVLVKFSSCVLDSSKPLGETPLDELKERLASCQHQADRELNAQMSRYAGLNLLQIRRVEASKKIELEADSVTSKWANICAEQATRSINRAQANLQIEIRRSIPFPCDEDKLREVIDFVAKEWRQRYRHDVVCSGTDYGRAHDANFEAVVNHAQKSILDANVGALKDIHSHVLEDVRDVMMRKLGQYYWAPSFSEASRLRATEALERAWNEYDREQSESGGNNSDTLTHHQGFSADLRNKTARSFVRDDMVEGVQKLNFAFVTRAMCLGAAVGLAITSREYSGAHSLVWVVASAGAALMAASPHHMTLAQAISTKFMSAQPRATLLLALGSATLSGLILYMLSRKSTKPVPLCYEDEYNPLNRHSFYARRATVCEHNEPRTPSNTAHRQTTAGCGHY